MCQVWFGEDMRKKGQTKSAQSTLKGELWQWDDALMVSLEFKVTRWAGKVTKERHLCSKYRNDTQVQQPPHRWFLPFMLLCHVSTLSINQLILIKGEQHETKLGLFFIVECEFYTRNNSVLQKFHFSFVNRTSMNCVGVCVFIVCVIMNTDINWGNHVVTL